MTQATARFTQGTTDAFSILTGDHQQVKMMFTYFEKLKESEHQEKNKGALVEKICAALTIHTQIEEEIFYPAVRKATGADGLLDEAEIEHAAAKELIAQLEEMEPGDDQYDAFVALLCESIDRHVQEEQEEMFPLAKKAKLDFDALGAQMLERKQELQASAVVPA